MFRNLLVRINLFATLLVVCKTWCYWWDMKWQWKEAFLFLISTFSYFFFFCLFLGIKIRNLDQTLNGILTYSLKTEEQRLLAFVQLNRGSSMFRQPLTGFPYHVKKPDCNKGFKIIINVHWDEQYAPNAFTCQVWSQLLAPADGTKMKWNAGSDSIALWRNRLNLW